MESTNINKGQNEQPHGAPSKDKEEGGVVTHLGEKDLGNPPKSITNEDITEEKKKEQQRTTDKKKLFLEIYGRTLGSIKATCEKVQIDRSTYREWRINDPEFEQAIKEKWKDKLEDVQQQLNNLILQADGPSVRYFLDRRDPEFKPRIVTEIKGVGKTPTQIMTEYRARKALKVENKEIKNGTGNNTTESGGRSGDHSTGLDTGILSDKEQASAIGAIRSEQSPVVLLEKENEKKSDSESKTKGNLEDHRRGPAPRVHAERN